VSARAAFPAIGGQRVGLLGGSFNPAHRGHLAISLVALKLLALDRIVWLVSPRNPLKAQDSLADYDARVASARATIAGHPRLFVSRFEADMNLRYSVDTVAALKQSLPHARFVFLMGADNLVSLPSWKAWVRFFEAIPIAVFARPGWDLAAPASQAAQRYRGRRLALEAARRLADTAPPAWVYVTFTKEEISATALRRAGEWPRKT
jgi:nicotinate-nucleotide adenylyltransferase